MPSRLQDVVSLCLGLVMAMGVLVEQTSAQTVWSGLTYSFNKPDGADGSSLEFQDDIAPGAVFARGFTGGLYNAATEPGWNGTGPEFTEWATTLVAGNEELDEEDITATNYDQLQFTGWLTAYGGGVDLALHERIQGRRAVVRLINDISSSADDIYFDIQFSYWAAGRFGGDGGFAYMRSQPPLPDTNGDYNGNFVVDAADYTVWRDTRGDEVALGSGADGFADGIIDDKDYDFWKERFGNVILAGSGSGTSAAVPEPANCLLLLFGSSIIATTRKRSPRGPGQTS